MKGSTYVVYVSSEVGGLQKICKIIAKLSETFY